MEASGSAADQPAQCYGAKQNFRCRINDIDRIDGLAGTLHLADMLQGLRNGPAGWHADELRRHQAARRMGRVAQQLAQRAAVVSWPEAEQQDAPGLLVPNS